MVPLTAAHLSLYSVRHELDLVALPKLAVYDSEVHYNSLCAPCVRKREARNHA